MEVPLYMTLCISLAAFPILSLTFAIFILCLGVGLFGFILFGTLYASVSFFMYGNSVTLISSNTFFNPFSLLLLYPYNVNIGMPNVIPQIS